MKFAIWFFIFLFFGSGAQAVPSFSCYSMPGMPVQVYEYASAGCIGAAASATQASQVGKDGEKSVVCMQNAACSANEKPVTAQPPPKTPAEIGAMLQAGTLKTSVTVCLGRGIYENGQLVNTICPTPTNCQKDIFYRLSVTSVTAGLPTRTILPATQSETNQ